MVTAGFSDKDLQDLAALLARAAEAELMPRFQKLQAQQVQEKTSGFDIVTEADEACEQRLQQAFAERFPQATVIGEEAAGRQPSLLQQIRTAELALVLDPLDGTRNFASGLPLFGLMVAVVRRGEVMASAIHDPVTCSTATALAGAGACMQHRDGTRQPLRVAAAVPLEQTQAVAGTNFLPEPQRSVVNRNLSKLMISNWFRCAAHEYRLAASGHMHVLFYNRLMPWDHAAGWLLHREAGGYSAHFDGTPYRPFDLAGGLLCAPDRASWQTVRDALLTP